MIRHGDALELMRGMAKGSVDVILTDPPYSHHVQATIRDAASLAPACPADRSRRRGFDFEQLEPEACDAYAAEFARLARRWVLVFCNVEIVHWWIGALTAHGLDYVRTGAWVKLDAPPQFRGDRPGAGFECVVIAHPKGRKRWNGGGRAGVWSHPIAIDRSGREPRLHPAQKPLPLVAELLTLFSDPGDTVLDPFAGSGTTGHACLLTGRRFVGVEGEARHHATALKRLEAAAEQPGLGLGVPGARYG